MGGPLYRQIADDLRRKIESEELQHGMRLPTEDQLMISYHASRNTVRGALRELTTGGLVYTLHGKGTFVCQRVKPIVTTLTTDPNAGRGRGGVVYMSLVASSGRSPRATGPRVEISRAGPEVAECLGISEVDDVIIRHEAMSVDDLPWSLQTSYYPRSLADRAPRLLSSSDIAEGTVSYLADHGIRQVGYRDEIEWRFPNEGEIAYFDLPADGHVHVVEIRRIAFDQEKNRVRLSVTVYRADRNQFAINVGDVPFGDLGLRPGEG
ncbi:MAG TPA: GntR family transcriptional regulator [Streptosporangiaceae bacterium]|nr:GntR family transcriptional regulator [Streptosporangiaceae bacterium]